MVMAAVLIGIFAVALLVSAREVAMVGQRRQAWIRAGAGGPLALVALSVLWLGITHPDWAVFHHDEGFGPGWLCAGMSGGSIFCERYPFAPTTRDQIHH
ncbi:MAG TPA: hypothetical protein VGG27_02525 [Magnetospirillaceae bacterium]|jgi:hypothetical protein